MPIFTSLLSVQDRDLLVVVDAEGFYYWGFVGNVVVVDATFTAAGKRAPLH